MDRLVIIGNGFDRAHNLPTSYYDFKEYLRYMLVNFMKLYVNIYQKKNCGFNLKWL